MRSVHAPQAAGRVEGRSERGDQPRPDAAQRGHREKCTARVVARNSDGREATVHRMHGIVLPHGMKELCLSFEEKNALALGQGPPPKG